MRSLLKIICIVVGGVMMLAYIFGGREEERATKELRKVENQAALLTKQAVPKGKTIEQEKLEIKTKYEEQKEQLQREITSIDKGVDFSTYRGTIEALQIELVLFGTWANLIEENTKSEDPKIKELVESLRNKVIDLQVREFPKMRKEYAHLMRNELWAHDIEVYSNGSRHQYINLTGGIFAANKNKQDFQNELGEALKMFRFKQSRFRWYEGEDEYTYWSINPKTDRELVTFK